MTAWIACRIAELSGEISRYPGPIARCDEHLLALLDERARLLQESEKQGCGAEALWANDGGCNAA